MTKQLASHILMVRPANFGYNAETAKNNAFQSNDNSLSKESIKEAAIHEFDLFTKTLGEAGIDIHIVQDTDLPEKADAVFPNNWVSFHENGAVITYPVYSPIRRQERREDIIEQLSDRFEVDKRYHLEVNEAQNIFLEGTGSMILDRPNKLAYACLSIRTDETLVDRFCSFTGYKKVIFDAVDAAGIPIYHTNVMMALGESFVVICMDTVRAPEQKQILRNSFSATGKEIIEISIDQMEAFAGNMLQVNNKEGVSYLVMSSQAFESLSEAQISQIEGHTRILHSPISTIETYGGGSARCMMAEIFLPEKEG